MKSLIQNIHRVNVLSMLYPKFSPLEQIELDLIRLKPDLSLIETVVFAYHFIENLSIVFLKLKYPRQGTTVLFTVGPTCVM